MVCFGQILRRIIIIPVLLALTLFSQAQNQPKLVLGANYYPGFLVAHRPDAKNLEAHIHGFELQVSKQESVQPWAKHYNKPEVCMGFMFMNLGNPDLVGNAIAVMPGLEFSALSLPKSEIRVRFRTGLSYLTKKFDIYANRRNQAIGSHVNGVMQGVLSWKRQFTGVPLQIQAGIAMTHFSNGSFRVPNLGVNMPSLFIGTHYLIDQKPHQNPIKDTINPVKWQVHAAYGYTERSLTNTTGFNIIKFGVTHLKNVSIKRSWRFGSDVFLDKTHEFATNPDSDLKGLKPQEMTELGIFAGHQVLISRVYFKTDIGIYLYKPSSTKFITYQRLGFNYHFNQKWFVIADLKIHFGVADHFSWGIGYRI